MQTQQSEQPVTSAPRRRSVRVPKAAAQDDFKLWAERRNLRISRMVALRESAADDALRVENRRKNRQMIKTVRAAHYVGNTLDPVVEARHPRWNHPAIAPPVLPRLGRSHLTPIIVLMILIWAGIMAFGIYKGLTPPSGMRIDW